MSDKISLKDAQAEINGLLVTEICRDFGINFRGVYPKHILERGVGPEQAFIGLAIKRGHLALPAVPGAAIADKLRLDRSDWVLRCLTEIMPEVYHALFGIKSIKEVAQHLNALGKGQ